MAEHFFFPQNPTEQDVVKFFEGPRGYQAFEEMQNAGFNSAYDLIQHTQGIGESSVVHLPDGGALDFVHLDKQEFTATVYTIAAAVGDRIF